ncbi:heterokaryon incompatibility protein-domain-containing protein [Echria macrotheca]|uniref:Heterokaryon incompatibility protein-domain-containing protein n=1 Tax=Echria macrotheca TaxID=438768 RepID=A0AAJ0F8C2_9PEZI|nr:heterokaryon incompatibility protein-domain-containing protein [Echria macrotheca]
MPDHLCSTCRNAGFSKYGEEPMEKLWKVWQIFSSSRPSIKIGTWSAVKNRRQCPFCRLVVDSVRTVADSTGEHPEPEDIIEISNRESWKLCIVIFSFRGASIKTFSNRADLEEEANDVRRRHQHEAYRLLVSWDGCSNHGQIQFLPDSERPRGERFFGRTVDARMPDWELLRWWLRRCERCHGSLCQLGTQSDLKHQLPKNMRVIDVLEKRVVPHCTGCEYVALTYVWGDMGWPMPKMDRERFRARAADGSIPLPKPLPRTVSDAMEATRRLGYRYLWFDSLCIVQDDDADRHSQLLSMDSIYRHADLSIAAASGDHADYGLPCISSPRRFQQHREMVSGAWLAVPLPRFDEINTGSRLRWNTRAWTFQEKALSQRLLIFTDYQVYFKCSNAVWSEDTAGETSGLTRPGDEPIFRWGDECIPHDYSTRRPHSLVDFLSFGTLSLANLDRSDLFVTYRAVVEEYTKRDITFQRDALPAIEGVLGLLNPQPEAYLAGLPREFFAEAILWHPKLREECIEMVEPGVPSWSWARWKLPKGCTWFTGDMERTPSLGAAMKSMKYWTPDTVPGATPGRHFESITISANRRHLPPELYHQLGESGCLLGWPTTTTYLILFKPILRDILGPEPDALVDVFALKIPETYGIIGEVITTIGVWKKMRQYKVDMVEASRGTGFQFCSSLIPKDLRPTTTTRTWVEMQPAYFIPAVGRTGDMEGATYVPDIYVPETPGHWDVQTTVDPSHKWEVVNVIMVEWVKGVAFRRGIGKVLASAWERAKPRETFVYLG